jgi:hypothetical protein
VYQPNPTVATTAADTSATSALPAHTSMISTLWADSACHPSVL